MLERSLQKILLPQQPTKNLKLGLKVNVVQIIRGGKIQPAKMMPAWLNSKIKETINGKKKNPSLRKDFQKYMCSG